MLGVKRADGMRAMPSARALLVASLANSGGFASQLPCRGGSFATNRPPADLFGQALLEDPPQ